MSERVQVTFDLDIPCLGDVEMVVESVHGREAISEAFSFDILFVSRSEIDPTTVVGQTASFTADIGGDVFKLSGVVAAFGFDDRTAAKDYVYVVTIGPRLGLLDLSRQNQVYGTQQETSLPDLIDAVLTNKYGTTSNTGGHGQNIPGTQRFSADYPSRSHVVQYGETDFAFLSRLCEHDGVFYFFEHGDNGDVAVFGDSNLAFAEAALPDGAAVPYRRQRQGYRQGAPAVTSFRGTARPVAGKIYLRDYNEETPQMQLFVEADVEGAGPGVVVEYGSNFGTMERGQTLAAIRAEEAGCRRYVFDGEATTPQLRPGTFFTLSEHPITALEGKYLVVSAEHRAVTPNAPGFTGGEAARAYVNKITCIRFDTPFRPARTTPVPQLGGVFTATIDAEGDGTRAELDDQGRYKVRLLYDEANAPDGKASTELRRAQPYAGKGDSGLHFPLLKSTEVVVSYLNGDPDRPVIVGALANPQTPDVVTGSNNVFNRIRSAAGTLIEMNDGVAAKVAESAEAEGVPQPATAEVTSAARAATGRRAAGSGRAVPEVSAAAPAGLPATPHGYAEGGGDSGDTQIFLRMDVPNVPGGEPRSGNYIRLGSYNPDEESGIVPGLPYYTSSTTVSSQDPKQAAADSGKQTSNKNTYTTVTPETHDASNTDGFYDGILIYSCDDLNTNIAGASMSKFGAGYTTQTTTGDSYHTVDDGQFSVFAKNGVALTAGGSSGSSPAADIKLTASNYIKQTAYGPLSENTYGDSHKVTYGNSYDEFHGDKTSYYYGEEQAWKIAASQQYYLNALFSLKLSAELTIAMTLATKMTIGGDIKIATPQDMKIIAGLNMTIVAGIDLKSVAGTTIKLTTTDVKVVQTTDTKVVMLPDTKWVLADIKFCEFKYEAPLIANKVTTLTADSEMVQTATTNVTTRMETVSSSIIGAIKSYM